MNSIEVREGAVIVEHVRGLRLATRRFYEEAPILTQTLADLRDRPKDTRAKIARCLRGYLSVVRALLLYKFSLPVTSLLPLDLDGLRCS